jgi:PPK2 family polyphosphate:nucleotide phosphotransferase
MERGTSVGAPHRLVEPQFRDNLHMKNHSYSELIEPYRVTHGKGFELKRFDPADTGKLESEDREESREYLEKSIARMSDLQELLYAQDRWALLLIFQAMDAAGKDGTIKHVMSGVNPAGCHVTSFKAPSPEELDHDYLWRATKALPERGRIGIFNRSHYEEVLVVRVHPELLDRQSLPLIPPRDEIWKERFEDINAYERYLARNGVAIVKFFLNVSKKEQKRRFIERLDDPEKNWKFAAGDVREREHWDEYMQAYEEMIRQTSSAHAPWFVVPADNKWYTRLVVASAVVATLESLGLHYPVVDAAKRAELESCRATLTKGGKSELA